MLNLNLTPRSHIPADCAVFFRSRERHGQLSNMTHGFPLAVNAVSFQGPEGLYQALKFPHDPDLPTPDRRPTLRDGRQTHRLLPPRHRPELGRLPRRRHGLHPGPQAPPTPGRVRRRPDRHRLTPHRRTLQPRRLVGRYARPRRLPHRTNVLGQLLSQLRDLLAQHQNPTRAAGILLANAATSPLTVGANPLSPQDRLTAATTGHHTRLAARANKPSHRLLNTPDASGNPTTSHRPRGTLSHRTPPRGLSLNLPSTTPLDAVHHPCTPTDVRGTNTGARGPLSRPKQHRPGSTPADSFSRLKQPLDTA